MSDQDPGFDVEHDDLMVAHLVFLTVVSPPPEVVRARIERTLRAERGEAWWRAFEPYADAHWQAVVDLGLI